MKHNFNAGPSVLPDYTIENTAKAVRELEGVGLSVLEISHRSKEFKAIMDEAVQLTKELLAVPAGYSVLFLGGGASLQFCMVPYNIMKKKAAYVVTGSWASKAYKEAKFFGEAVEVASSKDKNYSYVPKGYAVPEDADYLHITSNNTIYGTQIKNDPDAAIPVVADMSSDIFSRPVDVSKYGIIYAGAQKNLGPAGVALVIIKNELLGRVDRPIPSYLNYQLHIDNESLYNTPPCGPIFSCLQTLKWIRNLGGVEKIAQMNDEKSKLLYDEIDRNKLFMCPTAEEDRSNMNTCFVMNEEYKSLEADFLTYATSLGMVGIKGHRSVGGFRASTYNALPKASVEALVNAMRDFEKKQS